MTVEDAQKLPKVVLQTSEWDFVRQETHIVIPLLKKAGVYLDHSDYARLPHGFGPTYEVFGSDSDNWFYDTSNAIKKYSK